MCGEMLVDVNERFLVPPNVGRAEEMVDVGNPVRTRMEELKSSFCDVSVNAAY